MSGFHTDNTARGVGLVTNVAFIISCFGVTAAVTFKNTTRPRWNNIGSGALDELNRVS